MQESVKENRELYLGGSDIPIIMNLSPFKSRFELLLEKAGYKEMDFEGNVFTDYGNELEPVIRDWINAGLPKGEKFVEGKHIREAQDGELLGVRIHTDGENSDTILEIKTTSKVKDSIEDYKLYVVQLLYYMVLTDKPNGLLAVYERPDDLSLEFDSSRLHIFKVEKDTELIKEINEAIESFLVDLAKVKEDPFITEDKLLPVEIPDITKRILAFESQLEYMKSVEEKVKSEKARLKAAMESAGVKSWSTPNGYKITLVPDGEPKTESVFDSVRFRAEHPDLCEGYMITKTTKGKAGYIKITAPKKKED